MRVIFCGGGGVHKIWRDDVKIVSDLNNALNRQIKDFTESAQNYLHNFIILRPKILLK